MTKAELKNKALGYIAMQSTIKDEWYTSDRSASRHVLEDFLKEACGIDLCKGGECDVIDNDNE